MADQIQLRGGTAAESTTFTGAVREVTVDTTNNTLRVHDGSTAGGHVIAKLSDVSASNVNIASLESKQNALLAALGVNPLDTNAGAFTGGLFSDSANIKTILQTIETKLENKISLLGSSTTDLGAFLGSTIADGSNIKVALQALETRLEAVDLDTDDIATLTGIAENITNLGTFTGGIIPDQVTLKSALQALETATELRATANLPEFTGNLATLIGSADHPVVHRIQGGFPDINLRTNGSNVALNQNEGRLLWEDAGGGGVAAIKQTMLPSEPMRFFVGGITASEERMRILANGRIGIGETNPQAQLHVGGSVLVKADFPDFQMRSGGERRVIFEDAGGGAEGAIKFGGNTMKFFAGGIASSNELLSLNASGVEFPGTKVEIAKDAFGLRLERISGTQFDIGTANPGSGYNLNIKNSNGTDARVVVYSDLFWVRGLGGTSGNGNVKFDGTLDFDDVVLTGIQTSSESFSDDDVSLMTSAAVADYVAANGGSLNTLGVTATASELNILDGVTSTTAELNILDGVTSTASELNILDGVTATTAELNILDGVTSTATELNLLDGVTATTAELNYVDGVTSAIQTQLDGKYATSGGELTGSVTISTGFPDLTLKSNGERRLLFSDAGGAVDAGLKYASSALKFVYGGVASGDIEMKIEDAKVTVVNELALPATVSAAAASDITIVDNTADALEIKEGSNQYVAITTTDNGEKIEVFKNLHLAGERLFFDTGTQLIRLSDNKTSALKIENHDGSTQDFLDFKTANAGPELIFGAPNQFNNTITVGVDDTGYDVTFYGATASAYMQWDESADALILAGSATFDVAGDIDVDGTSNLDVLDVDGTANFASTVEVNDTLTMKANINFTGSGREIRFKNNTYNALRFQKEDGTTYMGFDSQGDATIFFSQPLDVNTTMQIDGTVTVGVDDTGYDVKFFGATASAYMLWDESEDDLILGGAAGLIVPEGQLTLGSTAVTSTAAELNILDGVTATTAELNYVDGVTSAIQTQINTQAALTTAHGTILGATAGTAGASQAVILDSNKDVTGLRNLTLTGNLTVQGTTTTVNTVTMEAANAVVFEGASADDHETTLTIIDPDADRTIKLPNQSGCLPVLAADSATAITSTPEELNILDGVTSTAAELNILDGVTSTAAELNILDGVTSTTAELNLLDGVTATTAELNYVDGVTSNIQTQLDAKLASSGAKAALDVDHLITLSGVSAAADNLGTFTGSTINDNVTVKAAIQALETAVETKQATDAELTELATMASTTAAALADLTEAEVQILDGATVTTAELNILDGVTADASDINQIDGITAGTVAASKAVVVDSNKDITGFRNVTATGTLTVDSVGVSAIQTSGESFADNDTSLMTSAAIDDRIAAAAATESSGTATLTFNGFSTNPDPKLTVTAYYCKVGKMVTITFSTSQNYSGYAGSATITGLPFAANSNADFYGTAHHDGSLNTSLNDGIIARIRGAANTTIDFLGQESNLQVSWSGTNATKVLNVTITYFTA